MLRFGLYLPISWMLFLFIFLGSVILKSVTVKKNTQKSFRRSARKNCYFWHFLSKFLFVNIYKSRYIFYNKNNQKPRFKCYLLVSSSLKSSRKNIIHHLLLVRVVQTKSKFCSYFICMLFWIPTYLQTKERL